jgi:enterochelin esterase-like enzyme
MTMKIIPLLVINFMILSHSLISQTPADSSGELIRIEAFASEYIGERTIDIYLPPDYADGEAHAVLYMHDGQMLFDSTVTWNKQEWMVDEVIQQLIDAKKIPPCIVVGIHNGGEGRHTEYFPNKPFQLVKEQNLEKYKGKHFMELPEYVKFSYLANIQSDEYLQFLVEELKPYIDKNYKTLTDKDHTFVAGSSMGGLISMYAICEYPEVFGGAACISTHWIGVSDSEDNPFPGAFQNYLRHHLPEPSRGNKIYFDYGTETLDALYEAHQLKVDEIMKAKGFQKNQWITRKFEGEEHSERSWSKRLDIPLVFLMGSR